MKKNRIAVASLNLGRINLRMERILRLAEHRGGIPALAIWSCQ